MTACDTLSATSAEAIDAVNAYVSAFNEEGGDIASTEGCLGHDATVVELFVPDCFRRFGAGCSSAPGPVLVWAIFVMSGLKLIWTAVSWPTGQYCARSHGSLNLRHVIEALSGILRYSETILGAGTSPRQAEDTDSQFKLQCHLT